MATVFVRVVIFIMKGTTMDTLELSDYLVEEAQRVAKEEGCTLSAQIEHWAHIGRLMEDNPDIPYEKVKALVHSIESEPDVP